MAHRDVTVVSTKQKDANSWVCSAAVCDGKSCSLFTVTVTGDDLKNHKISSPDDLVSKTLCWLTDEKKLSLRDIGETFDISSIEQKYDDFKTALLKSH